MGLLLAVGACGPADGPVALEALTPARRAVVGGAPEQGFPAVAAIVPVSPFCGEPEEAARVLCTGTLVAPRVVLTAAHCVENAEAPRVFSVVFATETARASAAQRIRVVEGRLHPGWRPGVGDVGVLILAHDAPVAPLAWEAGAFPADGVGRLARVVGFGLDDEEGSGLRRGGLSRITSVEAGTFSIEAAPAMSCGGDSGGPVFIEQDGHERLAGVTSSGDLTCTTGTNTRVDVHADFIRAAIDDVSRGAPARPRVDPEADACAQRCLAHADCPVGMACVARQDGARSCAVAGLEAGHFGPACTNAQGEHPCVKAGAACRLWLPCSRSREATVAGGCAAGGRGAPSAFPLVLLAWAWSLGRRAKGEEAASALQPLLACPPRWHVVQLSGLVLGGGRYGHPHGSAAFRAARRGLPRALRPDAAGDVAQPVLGAAEHWRAGGAVQHVLRGRFQARQDAGARGAGAQVGGGAHAPVQPRASAAGRSGRLAAFLRALLE